MSAADGLVSHLLPAELHPFERTDFE